MLDTEENNTTNTTDDSIVTPSDETAPVVTEEAPVKEEDVTKLDLTQPEHLRTFKSSYEKRVNEVNTLSTENGDLRTELDTIRANQGKGIYLDTNVPLEDFKATIKDTLSRMAEEEPDYYDSAIKELIEPHFWPSVGEQFASVQERQLDEKNEPDAIILNEMMTAWDVMSRRIVGVDGNVVYGILETIANSPDIKEELMNRVQGRSAYNSSSPFQSQTNSGDYNNPARGNPQPYQPSSYQQPVQVQTVEQIAREHNLDPSEPAHASLIRNIQTEQRTKQMSQMQMTQLQQTHATQLEQMQKQIEAMKTDQQKASTISDEELTRQAEQRLFSLVSTSLKDEISREYSNAVTKDKQHLLGKLETLVHTRLKNDPNYSNAERTAVKWFKQAINAKSPTDRDKWDKKGVDALAVMIPIRLKAIDAEAQELLGATKRRAVEPLRRPSRPRELPPSGHNVPPHQEIKPAPAGDITAAKEAIRKRAANLFQPR
jgi:hypothetical protein